MRLKIWTLLVVGLVSMQMYSLDALGQRVERRRIGLADVEESRAPLDGQRVSNRVVPGTPVSPSKGGYTWALFSARSVEEARVVQEQYFERRFACDLLQTVERGSSSFLVVTGQYTTRRDALNAGLRLPPGIEAEPWLIGLAPTMLVLDRYDRTRDPGSPPIRTELRLDGEEVGWLGEPAPEVVVKLQRAAEEIEAKRIADSLAADRSVRESVQVPSGPTLEGPVEAPRPVVRGEGLADLLMYASSAYESNIYQENEGDPTYGTVTGGALLLRTHPTKPILAAAATIARHQYVDAPEWSRVSRVFEVAFEPRLTRRLYWALRGEASLGGTSDDTDVSNQLSISQMLEYRFTKDDRLQVFTAYREKRVDERPEEEAVKPYAEVRFERRLPAKRRIEAGARYEINRMDRSRGNYSRMTFDLQYRTPVFGERDLLQARARYRLKSYEARFVEIEDEDFLRQDHQWTLRTSWRHEIIRRLHLILDYSFEARDSNDPSKIFKGHSAGMSMLLQII